jgi:Zn-dependent M28 family amino/carboxypeptidase
VAEAFACGPRPRRTVVFAAFGGEELGLRGSRAFAADDPRVPGGFAAAINVDMAARGPDDSGWIVGEAFSPGLAADARVAFRWARLEPRGGIEFTFRNGSDHWPLHAAGIPSILLTCSRFDEQDTPGDAAALLSSEKLRRMAVAAYWTVRQATERDAPYEVLTPWVKFPGEK